MGLLDRILGLFGGGNGDRGDASERDEPDGSDGVEGLDEMLGGMTDADGDDASDLKGIMSEVNAAADQVRDAEGDDEDLDPPESFGQEARELAEFWSEHDLDFTPGSLQRLDDFVDQQWDKERFQDVEVADGDAVHVDELAAKGIATQLGSYFGETLVRSHDAATWTDHEEFGWAVTVDGPDGEVVSNVFHVASDCLREPSKFAMSYRIVTDESGIEAAGA